MYEMICTRSSISRMNRVHCRKLCFCLAASHLPSLNLHFLKCSFTLGNMTQFTSLSIIFVRCGTEWLLRNWLFNISEYYMHIYNTQNQNNNTQEHLSRLKWNMPSHPREVIMLYIVSGGHSLNLSHFTGHSVSTLHALTIRQACNTCLDPLKWTVHMASSSGSRVVQTR